MLGLGILLGRTRGLGHLESELGSVLDSYMTLDTSALCFGLCFFICIMRILVSLYPLTISWCCDRVRPNFYPENKGNTLRLEGSSCDLQFISHPETITVLSLN